jgi:hypothetical protein
MAHSEQERQVRLILTPEEHLKFREYAARQGKPMAAVAKQVMTRFMTERGISRGDGIDPGNRHAKR